MNNHTVEILADVGSDHILILTSILATKKKQGKQKTRWNFKKANQDLFKETFDSKLQTLSGNFTNDDQVKECLYSYTSADKLQTSQTAYSKHI